MALGYLARPWIALMLTAVTAAVPTILADEPPAIDRSSDCDPSCGLDLVSALILTVPLALALCLVGIACRAGTRRRSSRS